MEVKNFAKFKYKDVKCYVCGKSDYEELHSLNNKYKEGPITFVKCVHDDLIYQQPCPEASSLEDFFNSSSFSSKKDTKNAEELTGYYDYLSGEEFRLRMGKERLNLLNKSFDNRVPLDILKIAPGTGIFLKLAKEYGHNELGIDISKYFVDYAKEKHGVNMIHSAFETYDFKGKKFDAILLFGAIMNVANPRLFLEKIYSLLKPEGQLHINYISSENWVYKLQRDNFWLIRPPVISFFNTKNFIQLLSSIGFNITYHEKEWQHTHLAKVANFSKNQILIKAVNALNIQKNIIKMPIPGGRYVIAQKSK